ncbi:hypothetical protein SBA4_5470005 [Candidatus Sulfopaludibacter sp. SbA4]|nr:hypothetical protein SBA4_5470005 [Candidatus Sulfopaludibacter sp. SbA4]
MSRQARLRFWVNRTLSEFVVALLPTAIMRPLEAVPCPALTLTLDGLSGAGHAPTSPGLTRHALEVISFNTTNYPHRYSTGTVGRGFPAGPAGDHFANVGQMAYHE